MVSERKGTLHRRKALAIELYAACCSLHATEGHGRACGKELRSIVTILHKLHKLTNMQGYANAAANIERRVR